MKIVIGNDHSGFCLKNALVHHLKEQDQTIIDYGTDNPFTITDYVDYATIISHEVVTHQADLGILCSCTGVEMSITANKVVGIRAAVIHDAFSAKRAKEQVDLNVLCLGEQIIGEESALFVVDTWLAAVFHEQRLQQFEYFN